MSLVKKSYCYMNLVGSEVKFRNYVMLMISTLLRDAIPTDHTFLYRLQYSKNILQSLDTDICQGKISACLYIKDRVDGLSSGGSRFTVDFKQVSCEEGHN